MQIQPFSESHVEAGAQIFVNARRQAQTLAPALSCPRNELESIAANLKELLKSFPGVAALCDGQLCGYLIGFALPEFMSAQRGIYCPEWAHGVVGTERRETYRQMYAALSPQWAENGCYTHAVTLFAHDAEALDVWFRNGFGLNGVDATRDLTPLNVTPTSEIEIRRAEPHDASRALPLLHALRRHMATGPIFLPMLEIDGVEEVTAWLEKPNHALWLAQDGRNVIAFLRGQTAEGEQRHVVSGADGIAISGAYTDPAWRSAGVASLLLNQMLTWGREQGLTRCSVDFESQNIEASRFWLRHFTPVCYSVLRRLDERIAWANRKRPAETFW
jgi:GNAT superfamily N-acetyltransferase